MSQPKKTKLGAAAQVVNAVKNVYNQAAPVTSTYTPLKAADRAAAGNAAARGIAQEPTIRASEAFGRAREKGFKRVYQTQSDRTRVGGGNIGGSQFSALGEYDPNYADDVWGVMDEGTASRLKNLSSPEHLFTTMLGSEDQLKTNPVVFEKLKRLFMREVKAGNMPPALLIKINEKLANAKVGKEGPAMFGEGVDILDPDLWRNLDTFDKRAAVADMMRGEGVGGLSPYRMTKKGDRTIGGTIFDAPGTLRAETDPMLLHPEMGGDVETFAVGPRAFSLTGTSEYRPDKHPGFPTILQGKDQRVKYKPVPSRTFLKDWYKEWEASPNKDGNPRSAAEKKKGPGYYPLALGMEGKGLPSQEISDDWLKELWREGHAEGGEIHGGLAHMAAGGKALTGPQMQAQMGAVSRAAPSKYPSYLAPKTPPPSPVRRYVASPPPPPPPPPSRPKVYQPASSVNYNNMPSAAKASDPGYTSYEPPGKVLSTAAYNPDRMREDSFAGLNAAKYIVNDTSYTRPPEPVAPSHKPYQNPYKPPAPVSKLPSKYGSYVVSQSPRRAEGGLINMAPGGKVIGTAARSPTSYMGTTFKPYTPPSAGPYKAPPSPVYQPPSKGPSYITQAQPPASVSRPGYVEPWEKSRYTPSAPTGPSRGPLTGPQMQAQMGTVPKSSPTPYKAPTPTKYTAPTMPSKYPSYVAKPAPAPVRAPTGMNFNLTKLGGGPFKDGGEVHAASGGYYTAAQMKAFNVPTAKPVPAKPSNRALTGPQMQAMSAPVTKMVPTKPSAAYSTPTTSKVMTGQQIQGNLNRVPVAPTVKLAPLPPSAPIYKAPVKKPVLAPTSAKAVTGPMVQAKLPSVAQQLPPVVKKIQPSVRMPTPVAKVTAPSTRASPSTAPMTSAIQAPAARMSSAMAHVSSLPDVSSMPTMPPTTEPDAPREYITPKLVSSDPAIQTMLEDQSFLEWLKSQKPPTEEVWQPPVNKVDDTYNEPLDLGPVSDPAEEVPIPAVDPAMKQYTLVNNLREMVGLPKYNTYEEYKAGEGVAKGGSIRMANGGSIPEGVIRHMKRAAIAARMHKAGGRVNG